MEKLHFSTVIKASKQKVWDTMLQDRTYREWTHVFNPNGGSYFEGDWSTGSVMRFLGPDKNGKISGMYARVKANRPYEFLSVQHLGEIVGGKETPFAFEGEFHENYTLKGDDLQTDVVVDLDSNAEFKKMFESTWPKALERLKELAEK